jgi:hypothetical protein
MALSYLRDSFGSQMRDAPACFADISAAQVKLVLQLATGACRFEFAMGRARAAEIHRPHLALRNAGAA